MSRVTGRTHVYALLMLMLSALLASGGAVRCAEASQDFRMRLSSSPPLFNEDDVVTEIQFGREVAARIVAKYGLYYDKDLTQYANLVAASLARNSSRPELEFHVAFIKTDTVNAYAAPGGYIFITQGALFLMENEAELAAVIAHEMGHINNRHIVKELNIQSADTSPVSSFTRFLGASSDPAKVTFLNLANKAMEILFERGYKIEDENEADRTALIYLTLGGYSPDSLSSYLHKVEGVRGGNNAVISKTHPAFTDRYALLAASIKEQGLADGENLLGAARFEEVIGRTVSPFFIRPDDVVAEVDLGQILSVRLLGRYPLLEEPATLRYANLVAASLARQTGRPELSYFVGVLDTDEVNAFSAPGGYLFITRGAIESMQDEAQLAALLAWEMASINRRTVVSVLNDFVSRKRRKTLTFEEILTHLEDTMYRDGFPRQEQRDLEARAVLSLALSGYDPMAMKRFLSSLATDGTSGAYLKTRLSPDERMGIIDRVLNEEGLTAQESYRKGRERFRENTAR